MKFPRLLHVQRQQYGADEPFLCTMEDGVDAIDGNDGPVAIYQLVSEGKVETKRTYVEKKVSR